MMLSLGRSYRPLRSFRSNKRWLSSSADSVLVNISSKGTAEVTLNRPSVHNAMSEEVIQTLRSTFEELSREKALRSIFLKANGKNFSAGADLQYMKRQANASKSDNEADALELSSMFNAIATSQAPTVALVNGAAFGGAMGLIAACDIAVGCQSSKFCFSEVKLGLIPATIGPFVLQRIGAAQARRFFLTAEVFEAQKALEIGLLHEVVDGTDEMEAFAKQLEASFLQNSPCAMAGSKKLIRGLVAHGADVTDQVRRYSAEMLAQQRETDEAREGITAFLEKRKPSYNTAA